MNEGEKHAEGIKSSIDDIIGVDTTLKLKRKSSEDIQREKFETFIRLMQEVETRSILMAEELQLDFSAYDKKFYSVIDLIMEMHFGKEATEIILFYLYEQTDPEESFDKILDENNNPIPLNNVADLWEVVKLLQSQKKLGRQRKK